MVVPPNEAFSRLDSFFEDEVEKIPILQLTPVWSDFIHFDPRAGFQDLCYLDSRIISPQGEFVAWLRQVGGLPFHFPVHVGAPELEPDGSMRVFEIRKIGPGTWVLNPSLHVPEVFHCFIVFCEVPEPAPWEKQK